MDSQESEFSDLMEEYLSDATGGQISIPPLPEALSEAVANINTSETQLAPATAAMETASIRFIPVAM